MKAACSAALTVLCLLPAHAGWRTGSKADLALGNTLDEGHFLNEPRHAVVAANQKVFVSDARNNRVLRFSSTAALGSGEAAEAVFGQTTLTTTGFEAPLSVLSNPQQLALDAAGNLWVADQGHHRVLRFANAPTRSSTNVPDSVLGQPDATTTSPGTTQTKMRWPEAVAVDGLGHLWVGDSDNHRILLFLNAAAKATGAAADKVLGQTNFTDNLPGPYPTGMAETNGLAVQVYGGNKVRVYAVDRVRSRVLRYDNALAKANGAPPDGVVGQAALDSVSLDLDAASLAGPMGVAIEGLDRLWVSDTGHNRILGFDSASALPNGAAATLVLGQGTFTSASSTTFSKVSGLSSAPDGALWVAQDELGVVSRFVNPPNATPSPTPTNRLGGEPHTINKRLFPTATAVDPTSGKLFVLEGEYHRILRYSSTSALADGEAPEAALGQPSLTATSPALGATRLNAPEAICVSATGTLWVADQGNHRVLRFKNAASLSTAAPADLVLGQNNFFDNADLPTAANTLSDPTALCTVAQPVIGIRLWVVDRGSNRVLLFNDSDNMVQGNAVYAASAVLGQPNFTDSASGLSSSRLDLPKGVAGDPSGRLWVVDSANNRVLLFNNAATGGNGAAATKVLGQAAFNTKTAGLSASALSRPRDAAIDSTGRLWVNDQDNHRIMRWDGAATASNGATADGVLGQTSFTAGDPGCRKDRLNIPFGLALDAQNRLFVGDYLNRRVLRFSPIPPAIVAWQKQAGSSQTYSMFVSADPSSTVKIQFSLNLIDWLNLKTISTNAVGNALTTVDGFGPNSFFRVAE